MLISRAVAVGARGALSRFHHHCSASTCLAGAINVALHAGVWALHAWRGMGRSGVHHTRVAFSPGRQWGCAVLTGTGGAEYLAHQQGAHQ